jgi:calcium-dependent protein kinase
MKIIKVVEDREGLDAMQKLFTQMDTDGNGTLSLEELSSGFGGCGVALDQQEVELLFRYLDADKSGDIDLEEVSNGGSATRHVHCM